jgi:hypothetical protein
MIVLDDFIKAIHDGVLSANTSLSSRNVELFEEYFEDSEQVETLQNALDAALKAAKDVTENPKPTRETFLHAKKILEDAGKALADDENFAKEKVVAAKPKSYKPKVVTIQYVSQTEEGLVTHDVNVPLITLVPLSFPQISQARFKTKLEIQEDNGKLMVSFPSKAQMAKGSSDESSGNSYFTEFEVTLEPQKEPEGLQKLVEGYEKMLRSQIPQ